MIKTGMPKTLLLGGLLAVATGTAVTANPRPATAEAENVVVSAKEPGP